MPSRRIWDEVFEQDLEQHLVNGVDEQLDRFVDQSHEDEQVSGEIPFNDGDSYSEIVLEKEPLFDEYPVYDDYPDFDEEVVFDEGFVIDDESSYSEIVAETEQVYDEDISHEEDCGILSITNSKGGDETADARHVFDEMPNQDSVSRAAMINYPHGKLSNFSLHYDVIRVVMTLQDTENLDDCLVGNVKLKAKEEQVSCLFGPVSVSDIFGRVDAGLTLFEEMKSFGVKPTDFTYSMLLPGLLLPNGIVTDMVHRHIPLQYSFIFLKLLSGQCNVGDLEAAADMLNLMMHVTILPEAGHYRVIIETLCKKGVYDEIVSLFILLYENQLFLTYKDSTISVWNSRGGPVTSFRVALPKLGLQRSSFGHVVELAVKLPHIRSPCIHRVSVDPETAQYFSEISNVIEGPAIDMEKRSSICGNALEETRGKEVELATDYIISHTLQSLLQGCGLDHLCNFLQSCSKDFPRISMDISGSHVAETTLHDICRSIIVNPVAVMTNCHGSHVLGFLLKSSKFLVSVPFNTKEVAQDYIVMTTLLEQKDGLTRHIFTEAGLDNTSVLRTTVDFTAPQPTVCDSSYPRFGSHLNSLLQNASKSKQNIGGNFVSIEHLLIKLYESLEKYGNDMIELAQTYTELELFMLAEEHPQFHLVMLDVSESRHKQLVQISVCTSTLAWGVHLPAHTIVITNDGKHLCLGSINLLYRTTIAEAGFTNLTSTSPEFQSGAGIFYFSLTLRQIQSLPPAIYNHMTSRMGSEYLAKMLSKHFNVVIKSRIQGIQSLINNTLADLEADLSHIGKPISTDAGGKMFLIMDICRAFDQIHKNHLDGTYAEASTSTVKVLYVTVSRTSSIQIVAQTLFEHYGKSNYEFQSDEDAKNQIENLIRCGGSDQMLLLVLDDVWSEIEFLVPDLEFQIKGYKILVTSRFLFPRFKSTYELSMLNVEDTRTLFRYSTFQQDKIPNNVSADLVNEIVFWYVGAFLTVAKYQGDFKERILHVLKEVAISNGRSVLFIDEFVVADVIILLMGARAVLSYMDTMFGDIAAQEVIKACSGMFQPIFQLLYFVSIKLLPKSDLSHYIDNDDMSELRTIPFKGGGNDTDMDHDAMHYKLEATQCSWFMVQVLGSRPVV